MDKPRLCASDLSRCAVSSGRRMVKVLSFIPSYESILLARRREFGPSSEANSIEGRLYDEAESLALTSARGEPGAEASDLADLSGSVA